MVKRGPRVRPQASEGEAQHDLFCWTRRVKETSVCIVDDAGKIMREAKVASEPEALLQVLTNTIYPFKRVGLEAGPLSQWLYSVLAEAGLPVICVETRHMRAVLKAQINKTDRNDARGIAQMMRVGLYRPVHVKTLRSQKLRVLLTHRKLLQSKAIAIENDLRATLRTTDKSDELASPHGGSPQGQGPQN
jgi:transposase